MKGYVQIMNPKVSVIVPVYNATQTLGATLGNLVHQSLQEIEIILINDASTDDSLTILNQCKLMFPDIVKVIDSPVNGGPGGAKNLGLQIAAGEYIGFCDSDDLVDPSMYEKLYTYAVQNDLDIVECGYLNEETQAARLNTADEDCGILDNNKRANLIAGGGYFWSKLFRRTLFNNPDTFFRKNAILEDHETLMELFLNAKSIGTIKEVLYLYKANPNSASKIPDPKKYIVNSTAAIVAIHDRICSRVISDESSSTITGSESNSLTEQTALREACEFVMTNLYSYSVNLCILNAKNPEFKAKEQLDLLRQLMDSCIPSRVANVDNSLAENEVNLTRNLDYYTTNRYISNHIAPMDIDIMKCNDRSSEELLGTYQANN